MNTKTILTVTTAFSTDSLAYVKLAQEVPAHFFYVNPRRGAFRILIAAGLALLGFVAVICALLASRQPDSLSVQTKGFVVVLFWTGLVVFCFALANLVINAMHSFVVSRFLAIQLAREEAEREGGQAHDRSSPCAVPAS